MNNFFKLVIAIVVSEAAGIIGSVFTISAIPTWYAGLVKPAAYLLVPYILWVSFASYLNYSIWTLN